MGLGVDVDTRERPAAVNICHTDSRGGTPTVAYCWGSLGDVYVCASAHCRVCEGRKAGGKDQWRSVRMHSWRAPSSITGFSPLSSVCVRLCNAFIRACLRQERLRAQNHFLIISSQFLHFLYVRVCVSCCMSSLYRCCFPVHLLFETFIALSKWKWFIFLFVWPLWPLHNYLLKWALYFNCIFSIAVSRLYLRS